MNTHSQVSSHLQLCHHCFTQGLSTWKGIRREGRRFWIRMKFIGGMESAASLLPVPCWTVLWKYAGSAVGPWQECFLSLVPVSVMDKHTKHKHSLLFACIALLTSAMSRMVTSLGSPMMMMMMVLVCVTESVAADVRLCHRFLVHCGKRVKG